MTAAVALTHSGTMKFVLFLWLLFYFPPNFSASGSGSTKITPFPYKKKKKNAPPYSRPALSCTLMLLNVSWTHSGGSEGGAKFKGVEKKTNIRQYAGRSLHWCVRFAFGALSSNLNNNLTRDEDEQLVRPTFTVGNGVSEKNFRCRRDQTKIIAGYDLKVIVDY